MDYTRLFQFPFVDRTEQIKDLFEFLESKSEYNVLLVIGEHGVGKSRFIDYAIGKTENITAMRICLNQEQQQVNCIESLLMGFQDAYTSISDYIFQNYTKVCNSVTGMAKIVKSANTFNISDVVSLITSAGQLFVDARKERHSTEEVICRYIETITTKIEDGKILTLFFDNFHLCDESSRDIIIRICKRCKNNNRILFLFAAATTGEQTEENVQQLIKMVPLNFIRLKDLDNADYFLEILAGVMDLKDLSINDVKRIHALCGGNPEKLTDFIHNLITSDGFNASAQSSLPVPRLDVVQRLLSRHGEEIDWGHMNMMSRVILQCVAEFGIPIPQEAAAKLFQYIGETVFKVPIFTESAFYQELLSLESNGILFQVETQQGLKLKFSHDLKYLSARAYFRSVPGYQQYNHAFYSFSIKNERLLKEYLTDDEYEYLCAYHANRAQEPGWESTSFQLAVKWYDRGDYFKACDLFQTIPVFEFFPVDGILKMLWCYYAAGRYSQLEECLSRPDIANFQSCMPFEYHYLNAIALNLQMNKKAALAEVQQARQYCGGKKIREFQIDDLEQQLLVNLSERQKAKAIYDRLSKKVTDPAARTADKKLYGKILRSTLEFYRGQRAQKDLRLAYKIAAQFQDTAEQGYVLNNMGFDLFWQGKIPAARMKFQQSAELLEKIKIHEAAYPWINIAVCDMMQGDYLSASHFLSKAEFWSKSGYADIMIKVNFMLCEGVLSDQPLAGASMKDALLRRLKEGRVDDVCIFMKTYYNISVVADKHGMKTETDHYRSLAFEQADRAKEDMLPYTWMKGYSAEIDNDIEKRLSSEIMRNFRQYRFDPWLITFTHT